MPANVNTQLGHTELKGKARWSTTIISQNKDLHGLHPCWALMKFAKCANQLRWLFQVWKTILVQKVLHEVFWWLGWLWFY